ncbi:MAG: NADH-quinone oxidoreductase subunit F [Chloroflexi bacterium]|nr:NADH-quinone oxidoreductase subunit F [Chloroflexota bacterium]MBL7061487.1 NADH-quinone oxidoreductase subunit F [Dehalococcoidia bacterium]
MTFAEIQNQAKSDWDSLYHGQAPHILIGTATCGRAAGALSVVEAFNKELAKRNAEAKVAEVGCIGLCSLEPLVTIIKPDSFAVCYNNVIPQVVPTLVEGYVLGDDPCLDLALGTLGGGEGEAVYIPELSRFEHEHRLLLRNCGYIDPGNINHYIANGGYSSLAMALKMEPAAIIEEIKSSGIRGRGGAGFPTGRKWELCRQAPGETKYVICNADEGDPGAFMDRVVLESDPQQVIEGITIAAYTVGAHDGFIYIRAEYPLAIERLKLALEQAKNLGMLGDNILGSGFSFDIEIVEGAGAFVSGESTALMYAIEGRRSMPRARPPHSVKSGLWGKPTVLNNVKTYAYVPLIIARGADWFSSLGTEGSKGTAVFALAGKMVSTGLAEVAMGTTLHELIFDIGGGIRSGKKFKAVQIGGPSGGCLPESMLRTPVDFDSLHKAGAVMGSGGVIAMDEDNCMVDTAKFFLDFIQKESCGKCSTCRIGTKHMLDILEDITAGKGKIEDVDLLVELGEDIGGGSMCGLGRTAPNPALTTIRYFRDEYEAHILEKRCPALVCKELIAYYILPDKCERGCEHCVLACPVEAIGSTEKGIKVIDQTKCTKCGSCQLVCPPEYNAVVKLSPPSLVPAAGAKDKG